jgi:formimidoylglutamate deiminase
MSYTTVQKVKYFHFKNVLVSNGWLHSTYVGVDQQGVIQSISAETPRDREIEQTDGIAVPGFQNCHSHAFQYAMAGMAETHAPDANDDFWSWREAMYQCALSFNPEQIQTIATALYIQMLKNGYTSVAEFHYLHHDKNGKPYSNPAEISVSLLAAAAVAGIRITLIPVHYQKGGFGVEANTRQRRFIFNSPDEYFRLLESAANVASKMTTTSMGFGVHSLRAANADDVIEIANGGPKHLPFHLHAAEQLKEVDDCIAHLKARPVEWLLNNLEVDERFNLVHCTHLSDTEVANLAKSKANVVLCPGTEGNLGDGIFRLADYKKNGGNWCIGTDSHISLNPLEDLRWLDYGQRLVTHKRNTFSDGGFSMIKNAFFSGMQSMGTPRSDFFEIGKPFDAVVYNTDNFLLGDSKSDHLLSRILYHADSHSILGTIINGKWIVKKGFHREEEKIRPSFKKIIQSISL